MNWLRYLFVLLLSTAGLVGSPQVQAATTCRIVSGLASGLSFGSVAPSATTTATGSITYECTNPVDGQGNSKPSWVKMCVGLGYNTLPTRMMYSGGDQLGFELYTPPPQSLPWGETATTSPPHYEAASFQVPQGPAIRGTIFVYGRVPAVPEQAAAGLYSASLVGTLRYGYQDNGNSDKLDCFGNGSGQGGSGRDTFQFEVQAAVSPSCTVVTATNMDFGTLYSASTGDLTSESTINLTCTNRTAWRIGLEPDPANGDWQMCNSNNACIAYQLFQPDGVTAWGQGPGGDTVDGVSAGNAQSLTVYGRVNDQPLTQAGIYSETVKVILTY